MKNLILASSDFVTEVLPIVRIVLIALVFVCSVVIIITTLLQSSADENGATAMTGQESYYSQNKGESKDGKLKKLTIIFSISCAVIIVIYFLTWALI